MIVEVEIPNRTGAFPRTRRPLSASKRFRIDGSKDNYTHLSARRITRKNSLRREIALPNDDGDCVPHRGRVALASRSEYALGIIPSASQLAAVVGSVIFD